ncbi:hypothetical protein DENSPDRAFT_878423 [Dentipellis sp. KUC8613]|nr:hypothetical protein DENSPDRAFT_878423 [Dentipellis sp. KUC8613]
MDALGFYFGFDVFQHGLVGQSLGPDGAEYIFEAGVLKADLKLVPFMLGAAVNSPYSVSVHHEYFRHVAIPPNALTVENNRLLVIDYVVNWTMGTIVRQRLWRPRSEGDRRKHVTNAQLCLPIFFVHNNGTIGMTLEDAVQGRCDSLREVGIAPYMGNKSSTQIRIGWLGYEDYHRQVQIKDETSAKQPINLQHLVQHVGRTVDYFLQFKKEDAENPSHNWRVGGPDGITRDEINVLGLIHVSSGSWMPLLHVTRNVLQF